MDGAKDVACKSIEIRLIRDFKKLANCKVKLLSQVDVADKFYFLAGTVVLGDLALVFPHPAFPEEYSAEAVNLTFPLREITGYFVVAYVHLVDSLGNMFPQLSGKQTALSANTKNGVILNSKSFCYKPRDMFHFDNSFQ